MTAAFVLGNGQSRSIIPLEKLRTWGPIYGCNAIYRDFLPTVLVSTDNPISERIQQEGLPTHVKHYTRRPILHSGSLRIPQEFYGYSSGPAALGIASQDKNHEIWLLGFDIGPTSDNKFNNIYSDTEFYKKSSSKPTYTGNWIRQLSTIMKQFPLIQYRRVMGEGSTPITELEKLDNFETRTIQQLLDWIGR